MKTNAAIMPPTIQFGFWSLAVIAGFTTWYYNLLWIRDTMMLRYPKDTPLEFSVHCFQDFFGGDSKPAGNVAAPALMIALLWIMSTFVVLVFVEALIASRGRIRHAVVQAFLYFSLAMTVAVAVAVPLYIGNEGIMFTTRKSSRVSLIFVLVYCLFGIINILSWFNATHPYFDGIGSDELSTSRGWRNLVNQLFQTPVTTSLTLDLFFVSIATSIWIVFDQCGRRVTQTAVRQPVRPLTKEESAALPPSDTDDADNEDSKTAAAAAAGGADSSDSELLAKPQAYISYESDGELVVRRERYFSVKRGVLYWGERKPSTSAIPTPADLRLRLLGSIALKDISDVFVGKQSPVFNSPAAADARPQQCFALVGRSATLYVQMSTEAATREWLTTFARILQTNGQPLYKQSAQRGGVPLGAFSFAFSVIITTVAMFFTGGFVFPVYLVHRERSLPSTLVPKVATAATTATPSSVPAAIAAASGESKRTTKTKKNA